MESSVEVVLNPNDSEQSISIPVLNDNVVETREFFRVELITTSQQSRIQLGQDSTTVVIEDDDSEFGVLKYFSRVFVFDCAIHSSEVSIVIF